MDNKYKPTKNHYLKVMKRLLNEVFQINDNATLVKWKEQLPGSFIKYLYHGIKFMPKAFDHNWEYTDDELSEWFNQINQIGNMISLLTPREFMNIFPITKDYDGCKHGVKDYFFTMNVIQNMGIDHVIDKPYEFLFDYMNWDIQSYMCVWMKVVGRMFHAEFDVNIHDFSIK